MSVKKRAKDQGGLTYSLDDLKALAEQIDECEEEMERMRQAHAREVDSLRAELNIARRAQIEAQATKLVGPVRPQPNTPAAVAEERKRVDRVLRDLEEERMAHESVKAERAELQAFAERAVENERASSEREAVLLKNLSRVTSELEHAKAKLMGEEKTVILLRSKLEETSSSAQANATNNKRTSSDSSPVVEDAKYFKRGKASPPGENKNPNGEVVLQQKKLVSAAASAPAAQMSTRARRV